MLCTSNTSVMMYMYMYMCKCKYMYRMCADNECSGVLVHVHMYIVVFSYACIHVYICFHVHCKPDHYLHTVKLSDIIYSSTVFVLA